MARPFERSLPEIIARARANFERETGRRWDDVFLSFGYALSSEDQRRKYRPAPYLMRAERELREEAEEGCAEARSIGPDGAS